MNKKRKKRPYIVMRFRKNDPVHNLYAATQHWLMSQKTNPLMIGGIAILGEGENRYRVCVGVIDAPLARGDKNNNAVS